MECTTGVEQIWANRPHHQAQNLLARSLHPDCYHHNPSFLAFRAASGLPFRAHDRFDAKDIVLRGEPYQEIAKQVRDPSRLLDVAGVEP